MWLIFIVIALFLAFWLYNISQQYIGPGGIEQGTSDTLSCSGYTYKISDIKYEDQNLTFTIENTIGDSIKSMEIISDMEKDAIDLGPVSTGRKRQIIVKEFRIKDSFVVYPRGCLRYNSREFISDGQEWVKR